MSAIAGQMYQAGVVSMPSLSESSGFAFTA
jgi:hypothetical protein